MFVTCDERAVNTVVISATLPVIVVTPVASIVPEVSPIITAMSEALIDVFVRSTV